MQCCSAYLAMCGRAAVRAALVAAAVLCAETLVAAPGAGGDLRLVSSDAQTVTLEFRPRYSPLDTVGAEGEVRQLFAGSEPLPSRVAAGSPDLRYRLFPLGFRADAGNAVRVISADYEDVPSVKYVAVPAFQLNNGFFEAKTPVPDNATYSQNMFLPVNMVQLSPVRRSRTMLLGNVVVFPVQYDPVTRVMRKYTRIVIEVSFGPATLPAAAGNDDAPYKNVLLNYGVARGWKTKSPGTGLRAVSSSVLANGPWYRLSATDGAIYKLDASYLSGAGIDLKSLDPRTIKIYGNGGRELPEDINAPRPVDLIENAIYVQGEADGTFDAGDYVLFYGASTNGWTYNPSARTLNHFIHHYSNTNYYWLTFGGNPGKRMADQPSVASAPDAAVDQFRDAVFLEEDKRNLESSGKDWVGQNLDLAGTSFTYRTSLPGLVAGKSVLYRFRFWNGSEGSPTMTLKESGATLGTFFLSAASPDPPLYIDYGTDIFTTAGTSSLASNASQLTFIYNGPSTPKGGYVDWFEILYPRMLAGVGEYLHFWSPDTTGVVEYQLQQFSALPWVFNVTDPQNVRLISGVGGAYLFRAQETQGGLSEYCAAGPSAWKTPAAITSMPNENIRGYAGGADDIIITNSLFRSAADRLAAFRRDPAHGGLNTLVVDVAQIYDEFSGGVPDVTALRDFLKYTYDNWTPQPTYVTLFGAASYDYKGILGIQGSFVPTWESANSTNSVDSYATDDFFAEFGPTDGLYLVLGRVNCRTAAEADGFVTKLMRYESSSVRDNWKQRMLFVGDDAWSSENGYAEGTQHSDAAETLSGSTYTPDEFEKKKIYIAEYPTTFTALGRRKPGAYQDIIDQINQGILMFNYAGHGNENQLAHEDIFDIQTSVPQLSNADRFVYFDLATCDFSHYDDPSSYTGSEVLINDQNAGAIGVMSASRKVYAGDNAVLNDGFYTRMFQRDAYGRLVVERPAMALFLYKSVGGSSLVNGENDQKFFCMGDPAMKLQYPVSYATIDSINGQRVDSVNNAPRTAPIRIQSLSTVVVSGTIRDASNRPDPSFQGTMLLTMNDASHEQTIVNFAPGLNWSYLASGPTIYKGSSSVVQGRFHATFIVPKDIVNADTAAEGRMAGYFYDASADGAAYTPNVNVSGTDTSVTNNGRGPAIQLFLGSRSFRPGDVVAEDPMLYVDLMDSSGINTSVSGVGHRIEAWVNNSVESQDLTSDYASALDNFRQGTVQVQLKDLPIGRNTVRVRAWDSFDNSSTADTYFDVASADQLQIFDVMNYPNPFAGGTSFTLRQNQSGPIDVSIKIYTIAGRLIQTLEQPSAGESFVRVPWDGRDRDGDILANGVYLYKVVVQTADRRFSSEAVGKLAILR